MPTPDLIAAVVAWWQAQGLAASVAPLYPTRVDAGAATAFPRVVLTVTRAPTVRSSSTSKVHDAALKFRCVARDEAAADAMVDALRAAVDDTVLDLSGGTALPLFPLNWATVPDPRPGPAGPLWTYDLDVSARYLIPNP